MKKLKTIKQINAVFKSNIETNDNISEEQIKLLQLKTDAIKELNEETFSMLAIDIINSSSKEIRNEWKEFESKHNQKTTYSFIKNFINKLSEYNNSNTKKIEELQRQMIEQKDEVVTHQLSVIKSKIEHNLEKVRVLNYTFDGQLSKNKINALRLISENQSKLDATLLNQLETLLTSYEKASVNAVKNPTHSQDTFDQHNDISITGEAHIDDNKED
ncbi:hypothetical protein OA5_09685 [Vibrio cyclitrophicus 1F111]|uniref:hypothetical protein n=1 Tax=Vibrio cyclitrophicus TaxID=47951 RepID=UPI000316B908|nr:hypothetical protein [Vibrio cyclitrophicus]OEF74382.1 hypothetical protein OA5_09685 [Vibrio cyclitrophicus 1F111]